jgi:hypothetical protein
LEWVPHSSMGKQISKEKISADRCRVHPASDGQAMLDTVRVFICHGGVH